MTVRLRCGRCRRVLARLPWRGTWIWADGAVSRHGDDLSCRCRCGAQPSISPGRLAKAAMRAQAAGWPDLYTDVAGYGLPAHARPLRSPQPWPFTGTPSDSWPFPPGTRYPERT